MTTCCQLALMASPVSDSIPARDGSETAGLGRGLRPEGSRTAIAAPGLNLDEHGFSFRAAVSNRIRLASPPKGAMIPAGSHLWVVLRVQRKCEGGALAWIHAVRRKNAEGTAGSLKKRQASLKTHGRLR